MNRINSFASRGSTPESMFEEDGCSIEEYTDQTAFAIRHDSLRNQGFQLTYSSKTGLNNATLRELQEKRRGIKMAGNHGVQITYNYEVALFYKVD